MILRKCRSPTATFRAAPFPRCGPGCQPSKRISGRVLVPTDNRCNYAAKAEHRRLNANSHDGLFARCVVCCRILHIIGLDARRLGNEQNHGTSQVRCTPCFGTGVIAELPCPDCGGYGYQHCCDGLQEQPEQLTVAKYWPQMEESLRMIREYRERRVSSDVQQPVLRSSLPK